MKQEFEYGAFGVKWQCGWCKKKYTTKDFLKMDVVQVKEGEPKYGNTPVCSCGYRFHLDKFKLRHPMTLFDVDGKKHIVEVSTVFLELNRDRMWYETMIFPKNEDEVVCHLQRRYKTLNEAIDGHIEVLLLLERKRYKILKCDEADLDAGKKELIVGDFQ